MTVGSCACGDIRFQIEAEALGSGQCWCPDCQRATGGGPASAIVFPASALMVTGAKPRGFDSSTAQGNQATREFCGQCGTPLFGRKSSSVETVAVMVGAIDSPKEFTPQGISWSDTAPEWACFPEGVPKFPRDISA